MRFGLAILVLSFVIVPVTASAQSESPTQPSLTSSQEAELESGEIIVRTRRGSRDNGGVNRGESIGLVCAPMDEVVAILEDFPNQTAWMPDLETATVISTTERIGEGRTHMPWPIADRRWRVQLNPETRDVNGVESYVATYENVEFDDGNMDALYGYWLIREYNDECTLVRYVINADIGVALPPAIINWASRRLLPGVITGLRERHDALH